jgi:predicted dehydrogenase
MLSSAVIGTGFMGPTHIEALRRLGVPITGILGVDQAESAKAAKQMSLPRAYEDYQAVLDDPNVRIVHITTPNHLHLDQAMRALLAGKHVICEKPLGMNTTETGELVALSRQYPNQAAVVHFNIRFYPMVLQAREIVRSGGIGEVYHVTGGYFQDWLLYDTDWNWRLVEGEGGRLRAVGDIGSHWMDLVHFVTGLEVVSLCADVRTFVPVRKKPRKSVATFKGKEQEAPVEYDEVPIRTEDWASVVFHYDNGGRGTMTVSQVDAGRKNRPIFEIAGSKGSITWDGENPAELLVGSRDHGNEIIQKDPSLLTGAARYFTGYPGGHAEGYPDTFKMLYRAVHDYIEAGDWSKPKSYPTFEDGHLIQNLCETIAQSAQERRWIDVK